MTKNRNISLLIFYMAIGFIVGINLFLFADEYSEQRDLLLKDANDYIYTTYGVSDYYPEYVTVDGVKHYVNLYLYDKYKVISYYSFDNLSLINEPKDVIDYQGDFIYRYIGYTNKGDKLYNNGFPADTFYKSYSSYDFELVNDSFLQSISSESRDKLLSNLLKSASADVYASIDRHYSIRSSLYEGMDLEKLKTLRKKDWDAFFYSKDRVFWASTIEVQTLPTPFSKGSALLRHDGYYIDFDLLYEDNTDGYISIKHVPVSKSPTSYIMAYDNNNLTSHDYIVHVNNGDGIDISAHEISDYKVIGYTYFDGNNRTYSELSVGDDIGLYISAKSFIYKYQFDPAVPSPVLVFYYEKNDDPKHISSKGVIRISSDDFDVERAIPSSEPLTIRADIDSEYLCDFDINRIEKTLYVNVYFDREDLFETPIKRELKYRYHVLDNYYLYFLDSVLVNNDKIKKGGIVLKNTNSPNYTIIRHDVHQDISLDYEGDYSIDYLVNDDVLDVFISLPDDIKYLSMSKKQSAVDEIMSSLNLMVRNDLVNVGGKIVLNDLYKRIDASGESQDLDFGISLKKSEHIDKEVKNGVGKTSGTLVYHYISGDKIEIDDAVTGNPVRVFTPVYNHSDLIFNDDFDQRAGDKSVPALVLDGITQINLSSEGTHISEKGYGTRDYNKYVKKKVLVFPFDVFVSSDKKELEKSELDEALLYKKNEKISISPDVKTVYIKPAIWEKENFYEADIVYLAINATDTVDVMDTANLNIKYNAAIKKYNTELTGRLFDFRIESIDDPRFKGLCYITGDKDKQSNAISMTSDDVSMLPVMDFEQNRVLNGTVKLGYPFEFSVKTIGNFKDKGDVIIAKPKFLYIDNKGNIRRDVRLFVKQEDGFKEFTHSDLAFYDKKPSSSNADILDTMDTYSYLYPMDSDISDMSYKLMAGREVFRFKPNLSLSTSAFRVFDGDKLHYRGVDDDLTFSSIQKWTFSYALPNNTIAFLPDDKGRINYTKRLLDGYIGIYFDIYASKNYNYNGARLRYKTVSQNEWQVEGYKYFNNVDEELIILYNLSEKASDDLRIK